MHLPHLDIARKVSWHYSMREGESRCRPSFDEEVMWNLETTFPS